MKQYDNEYFFHTTPRTLPEAKELIWRLRSLASAQHELIMSHHALEESKKEPSSETNG